MTSVAITGASGRMGQRLIALANESKDFDIVATLGRGGELKATPDVLIDFSSSTSLRSWLKICVDRGIPIVIGTTGLSDDDFAAIDAAATSIAVLQAANTSLAMNLLFKVAADVAKRLGDDYDLEIFEAHHRHKKDAPSGTAMKLAVSILAATGKTRDALVIGRQGDDAMRQRGDLGMTSARIGDEVGTHTVYFAGLGERLELTHRATSRDTFAHGALKAAEWLKGKRAGRYSMNDVLDLH